MAEKTTSEKIEQVGRQMMGCGCALTLGGVLLLVVVMVVGMLFS